MASLFIIDDNHNVMNDIEVIMIVFNVRKIYSAIDCYPVCITD